MSPAKKAPAMRPTGASVREFLAGVPDERRRGDAERVCELMAEVTGEEPVMWGPSIVGFGSYHYRYASGHEGDAPVAGFSPRKANLVVYLATEFETRYPKLLERLGPYKAGKGCLYLKRLDDINLDALRDLIDRSARVARGLNTSR